MGGSLAAALKKNTDLEIAGADIDPLAIKTALDLGIIDRGYTDFREPVSSADIIFLAAPITAIIEIIPEVGRMAKPGAIVTDLGSTKEKIMNCLDALPAGIGAIGGHPMCGKFESGVEHADAELFRGKTYVLVSGLRTTPEVLKVMEDLIGKTGGIVRNLKAVEHDRLVSITSHLPRVLPLAILSLADKENTEDIWDLAGGNLRNSTLLADDNIRMWQDVILTNSQNLSKTIHDLCGELETLAGQIEKGDSDTVLEILEKARVDWNSHFEKL